MLITFQFVTEIKKIPSFVHFNHVSANLSDTKEKHKFYSRAAIISFVTNIYRQTVFDSYLKTGLILKFHS